MPNILKPINRNQVLIATVDQFVKSDSMVRIIDAFVDNLDLKKLGFKNTKPCFEGRPRFDTASMVKLLLWGYEKKIRSSRELEKACEDQFSFVWLMCGLHPNFRTISEFRKNNIDSMKNVFKEFTNKIKVNYDAMKAELMQELEQTEFEARFISVDGSKFKACNSKDRNFTRAKLEDRINRILKSKLEYEEKKEYLCQEAYLRQLDNNDKYDDLPDSELEEKISQLNEELDKLTERLEEYKNYKERMLEENASQISLTDEDARLMKNKNGTDVSYNVQTAVDSETHLIVNYIATNRPTDHGLLAPTVEDIKAENENEIVEIVADKGYEQTEDMVKCLENGIIPNVIPPEGKDTYSIEIAYEEDPDCDKTSTKVEDLKKCLHAGVIPNAYADVIEDIEVVTVRRKVKDGSDREIKSPYGTEEEMKERAEEGYFVRDPERDIVICPGGEILNKKAILKSGKTRYANKLACSKCPLRSVCVKGAGITKWKEIDFSKDTLEKRAKWFETEEQRIQRDSEGKKSGCPKGHMERIKVVKFTFRPDKGKMVQRKCISEHPFGTIKRAFGANYFLLKGKRKVEGEFALFATAYNMSRAKNMFTFDELMEIVSK